MKKGTHTRFDIKAISALQHNHTGRSTEVSHGNKVNTKSSKPEIEVPGLEAGDGFSEKGTLPDITTPDLSPSLYALTTSITSLSTTSRAGRMPAGK